MFSSAPNYNKLKTNLRLACNRLKLLEKKKTETNQKARKEIAGMNHLLFSYQSSDVLFSAKCQSYLDFITIGKPERARIRVESIIREDVRKFYVFSCNQNIYLRFFLYSILLKLWKFWKWYVSN